MSEAGPPGIIGLDEASFEEFVAGSSGRLFTMARLLTGGHRAEAEDLLQGAFERAYRRWGRISRRADPERNWSSAGALHQTDGSDGDTARCRRGRSAMVAAI